VSSKTVL